MSPLTPLEKDIQSAIIQAFAIKHRVILWPIDAGCAGMRKGAFDTQGHSGIPTGFPDLMGIGRGGIALFIEVKRPGKKPRPNQISFLETLNNRGAIAFWSCSVESALGQYEDRIGGCRG